MLKRSALRNIIHRCSNRGFSLVELMVVLSISAILVGIAAPNFSNWLKDNRIEAIASQTRGMLNTARTEAISRGETARIEFDSGSLVTCIVSDLSKTCDDSIENAPLQYLTWDAESIAFGSNGAIKTAIIFDLRGRLLPRQNSILLTFCDDRGKAKGLVLTLNQIGRVTVGELAEDVDAQCL